MPSLPKTVCLAVLLALACTIVQAQMPGYDGIGRAPTDEEIQAWDIAISLDGDELPTGQGTASDGKPIYEAKCAGCHGMDLEGVLAKPLAGGKGTLANNRPFRTVGSYWPFATTLWDYINRAMPFRQEGTLTANEVYDLTAYILYRNDIIGETEVMNARSLPKVKMPNRDGFIPRELNEIADTKKRGCRMGHCP